MASARDILQNGGVTGLSPNRQKWLFSLLLVLVTFAVYWPVRHYDFINYDDDEYVYANNMVRSGWSWAGFGWAFMDVHAVNWHPLTWLSHMLDCQLFGVNPGAHHLVNVLIHCVNAVLLLWLLDSLTRRFWRCVIVAALFALHPLRVQSVAWIAERKDVLSSFFFLLSLFMYVRHARTQATPPRPGADLRLALLFYLLALLSKPMVVTLPLILLLLDFWPLGRIGNVRTQAAGLLFEKWPFFVLSAVFSGITVFAQHAILPAQAGNAVSVLQNVALKYLAYVETILWPHNLSFLCLRPESVSGFQVFMAALALMGISGWVLQGWFRRPWAAVGWSWFLLMLAPVTLVQLPALFIADRYTYLPGIGFSLLLVWSVARLLEFFPVVWGGKILPITGTLAALLVCVWLTRQQLGYWQNTQTLLEHALKVNSNNAVAQINLRVYLFDQEHPGVRDKRSADPPAATNQPVRP